MARQPPDPARVHGAIANWLSELTHEGIFATDAELRVIAWNRWMELHTRRPAADVIGRPLLELYPQLVARELDRCYRDALEGRASLISHGLHQYLLSLAPTHPDLELQEMPQSARIGPLVDGETVIGSITTIENVSERLASEAELRKQIEAQHRARASAEAGLRAKDEFLSILSHELRQPLNAVLGWARILMTRQDSDPEVLARALQVIERNASAQASMIDDILDVARIVAGKLRLEMEPNDLLPVILAAIDAIAPAAAAKQVSIRTELEPGTPRVLGDRVRLQQVMWNLLSNAVKFTEPGGSIDVSLAAAASGVRITVRDTGSGISPEFLPFVFERFQQSDSSSARRQGGLGLGLALVRHLIELHGGTVRAASAGPSKGAVFTIELPIVVADASRTRLDPGSLAQQEASLLCGVRALVVEDDADARELLVSTLARCGAEVFAASSAAEALGLLVNAPTEQPFHVMVSDIGMPNEDGYELMRRVRALHPEQGGLIPAVAVTAYANPDDRERVLAAGYQIHVPKPMDPLAVASAVELALRRGAGA